MVETEVTGIPEALIAFGSLIFVLYGFDFKARRTMGAQISISTRALTWAGLPFAVAGYVALMGAPTPAWKPLCAIGVGLLTAALYTRYVDMYDGSKRARENLPTRPEPFQFETDPKKSAFANGIRASIEQLGWQRSLHEFQAVYFPEIAIRRYAWIPFGVSTVATCGLALWQVAPGQLLVYGFCLLGGGGAGSIWVYSRAKEMASELSSPVAAIPFTQRALTYVPEFVFSVYAGYKFQSAINQLNPQSSEEKLNEKE